MSRQYLAAKAAGFTNTIKEMTGEERQRLPEARVAKDFNNLRNLVLEFDSNLERYLPPELSTRVRSGSSDISLSTFGEIYIFADQIYQLLSCQTQD